MASTVYGTVLRLKYSYLRVNIIFPFDYRVFLLEARLVMIQIDTNTVDNLMISIYAIYLLE